MRLARALACATVVLSAPARSPAALVTAGPDPAAHPPVTRGPLADDEATDFPWLVAAAETFRAELRCRVVDPPIPPAPLCAPPGWALPPRPAVGSDAGGRPDGFATPTGTPDRSVSLLPTFGAAPGGGIDLPPPNFPTGDTVLRPAAVATRLAGLALLGVATVGPLWYRWKRERGRAVDRPTGPRVRRVPVDFPWPQLRARPTVAARVDAVAVVEPPTPEPLTEPGAPDARPEVTDDAGGEEVTGTVADGGAAESVGVEEVPEVENVEEAEPPVAGCGPTGAVEVPAAPPVPDAPAVETVDDPLPVTTPLTAWAAPVAAMFFTPVFTPPPDIDPADEPDADPAPDEVLSLGDSMIRVNPSGKT